MKNVKSLDQVSDLRRKNKVKESLQTEYMRQNLSNDYDFSSKNRRPRSQAERKILKRFADARSVDKI